MPGPLEPDRNFPSYQPRPPRRRTTWLWIALAVAAVIITVLSTVVVMQHNAKDSGTSAAAATASPTTVAPTQPTAAQPPPAGASGSSMTCNGFTASVDPSSQPGWHATIDRLGLAYAVPPDWTVAECGVRMGWAKPCPQGQCVIRDLGAVATVANPACEKQNLAMAGVANSKNPDIRAALDEESATVPLIYTQNGKVPEVELGPVREFSIGGRPAVQMVATVKGIATDACNGPSAFHSMVITTVPNVEGSVAFVISLREGANVTPKADMIDKIVDTVRTPA